MQDSKEPSSTIAYSPQRRRRGRWKICAIGTLVLYVLGYAILRFTGVYYAYYSQGSWEISGDTGIVFIDVGFLPMCWCEDAVLNQVRLLPEPTGG